MGRWDGEIPTKFVYALSGDSMQRVDFFGMDAGSEEFERRLDEVARELRAYLLAPFMRPPTPVEAGVAAAPPLPLPPVDYIEESIDFGGYIDADD